MTHLVAMTGHEALGISQLGQRVLSVLSGQCPDRRCARAGQLADFLHSERDELLQAVVPDVIRSVLALGTVHDLSGDSDLGERGVHR